MASYELLAELTASDTADGDNFGFSVACSDDVSVIVVGARFDDYSGKTDAGKVYVYTGANWGTETMITASDGGSSAYFGTCVSCSADGSVIAVGAIGANDGGIRRGEAYVYSGASWGTETKLTASDGITDGQFGGAIAVSADGSVVVVGARGSLATSFTGKAYVYSGTNWGTETILTASDAAAVDEYGQSVAASEDGSTVFVGAYGHNEGASNTGAVYAYTGTNWGTETELFPSSPAAGIRLGISIDCSSDASILLSGVAIERAYVYSGTNWGTETIITGTSGEARVAITPAGDQAVVSNATASSSAGSVDVYSGSGWSTVYSITAYDGASNDRFGDSVACSDTAEFVVVGAPFWEGGSGANRGKVYVYQFQPDFVPQIYRRL